MGLNLYTATNCIQILINIICFLNACTTKRTCHVCFYGIMTTAEWSTRGGTVTSLGIPVTDQYTAESSLETNFALKSPSNDSKQHYRYHILSYFRLFHFPILTCNPSTSLTKPISNCSFPLFIPSVSLFKPHHLPNFCTDLPAFMLVPLQTIIHTANRIIFLNAIMSFLGFKLSMISHYF